MNEAFHTSQQLSLTKCPSADPVKQKQPAAQPGQIPNPQPMSCNYVTMTRFWPLRLERTTITHCLGKEPSRSTNLIKITGSSRGPAPRPREGCAGGLRTAAGRKLAAPRASETREGETRARLHNEMAPRGQVRHDMSGTKTYVVVHLPPRPAPRSLYSGGSQRQQPLPAPTLSPAPIHQGRSPR